MALVGGKNQDIQAVFEKLNKEFFQNKIKNVEVKWSSRMTACAGICTYNGKKAGAIIHLSVPLLSLRTERDMVEILAHEMIHAYLCIVDGNKEREEHGPKFNRMMDRINAKSGMKITVFHTFEEEVEFLKQHWWICSGKCKSLPPMFGVVKRSMNRAPGPSESWWVQHRKVCSGKFVKVKEPKAKPQPYARLTLAVPKTPTKPRVKSTSSGLGSRENRKTSQTSTKCGQKRGQSNGGSSCSRSRSALIPAKRKRGQSERAVSSADPLLEKPRLSDPIASFNSDYDPFEFEEDFEEAAGVFTEPVHSKQCPACGIQVGVGESVEEHLDECRVLNTEEEDSVPEGSLKYPCPICRDMVQHKDMERHLDACIQLNLCE